jgi:hypothetical protein
MAPLDGGQLPLPIQLFAMRRCSRPLMKRMW